MNNSSKLSSVTTLLRKIVAVTLITMMLVGCSYRGKLEPNLSINSSTMVKHPYTLAIDSNILSSSQVNADPLWFNLTVDSGEALTELLKHQLSQSFESVVILNGNDVKSTYDYIITIDPKTTSRCTMSSCGITTKASMQMVDTRNIDNVILVDDFLDVYAMQMPGSTILVNFLTGVSLFVLAPILQPISAHFAGKELTQRVIDSNERISFQVTKKIVNSDIYKKRGSESINPN